MSVLRVLPLLSPALALRQGFHQPGQPAPRIDSAASDWKDNVVGMHGDRSLSASAVMNKLLSLGDDDGPMPRNTLYQELSSVPVTMMSGLGGVALAQPHTLPKPEVCSMVSNSQTLLLSKAGHTIDSVNGSVVRFNDAKTKGYEEYVGNRTDILIVNDVTLHQWFHDESGPKKGIKHVIINDWGRDIKDPAIMPYLRKNFQFVHFYALEFRLLNMALLRLMNQTAVKHGVNNSVRPHLITTGMLGAIFLMNLCKEVHHFGFLPIAGETNNCRQHYWTWHPGAECTSDPLHFLSDEHVLWAAMSTKGELEGEGVLRGQQSIQHTHPPKFVAAAAGAAGDAPAAAGRPREPAAPATSAGDELANPPGLDMEFSE